MRAKVSDSFLRRYRSSNAVVVSLKRVPICTKVVWRRDVIGEHLIYA